MYVKRIALANVDCTTDGTTIYKFSLASGEKGEITNVATSGDAVEIDIAVNGQSLGAKYGLPWDCRAIALFSNGMPVKVELPEGSEVEIKGKGIGGTVTLNAIAIEIVVHEGKQS